MHINRIYIYPLILVTIATISYYVVNMTVIQVASLTIFSSFILGTLLFWRYRLAFALVGIAILMTFDLLTTDTLIEFAGLDIILFLISMMIVIGYLEERHFFEHLLEKILARIGNNPNKLIILLMLMSGTFAALVDEVTSILFMVATILHLTAKLRINPIPFIIMIVFATNIGSSATLVGNPVGVLIALRADLTFAEFLRWATPISIAGLVLAIILSLKYFSKDIQKLGKAMSIQQETQTEMNHTASTSTNNTDNIRNTKDDREKNPILSDISVAKTSKSETVHRDYKIPWILFIGTIVGLVAHSPIETALGLEKNVMLLAVAFAAAGITLFMHGNKARELVERRVDWWTLGFFIFLFASVGTLQLTGVTTLVSNGVFEFSGGDETNLFFLFSIIAGVAGALMDNVLGVATFIPIVTGMTDFGINPYPLWWGLLFAATFFGNLTLIGSTANIVALGMLERQKRGHITLMQWIKPGAIIAIPTLALALILLYIQIPLMPGN
ncbi:MAG TPA: SLC13 family permease [Nitrososphaeraceae archaeon]|nr:SLC13 family permease [Nitrososphaeraceae archaeon]